MNAEERKEAADAMIKANVIEIDATTLPGLSIGSDKAVDFLHVMNSMEARQDLEAELWRQKSSSKSEQKIAILDTLIQFELQETSPLLDCMNYPFASNVILIWLDERIVDRPMPASIVKNLRRLVDTGHIQINFNREHANAAIGMGITARGAAYLNTQTNRGELGHVEEVDVLRLLVTGSLRKTMIGGANIGNLQTQRNSVAETKQRSRWPVNSSGPHRSHRRSRRRNSLELSFNLISGIHNQRTSSPRNGSRPSHPRHSYRILQ